MASEESAHLTAAKTSDYGSTNDYGGTETSEYGTANEYGSAVETGVSEYGSAGTGVPTDGAVGTGVSEYGSAAVSDYGSAKAAEASGVPDTLTADAEVKPQENNSTKLTASDEFLPYVASSGSSDSENDEKERKEKDKERKSRSGSPEHRKSGSRSSSRSSGSSRSRSPSPKKEKAGAAVTVTSPIPVPDAPSSSSSSKPFAFGQSRGSRSRSRSRSGSTSRSRSDRRRRRRSPRRHRSRSHSPRRRRGTRRRRHHSRDRHRRRHRRRRSRSRSHGRSRSRERRKSRERRRSRSKERKRSRDRHRERPARHEEQHGKITYKEHLKQSLLNAQKEMEKTGKLDLNCDTNKELSQYLANRGEKPSKLPIYDDPVLAVTGGVELDDKVTPQMAFIHSMKEMHRKAQELTGVAVPKYYNPAAVNPMKYAEQVQKRKLLWSKAKDESTETKPAPTWQAAAKVLEKETDGKSSEKFKKLMGIKAPSQESDGKEEDEPETEAIQKKQNDLFNQLNKEYEFARMATHTHKGIGLGFTSHYQTFAQQAQQGKAPNPGTEPE